MPRRTPEMHAPRNACLVASVVPGSALANMSHVSAGGAAVAIAIVVFVLLVPPLLGPFLAARGRRKRAYAVSLLTWLVTFISAFYLYSQISPYTQAQMSPWAVPRAVGLLALVYAGAVFVCLRVLPRFRRSGA